MMSMAFEYAKTKKCQEIMVEKPGIAVKRHLYFPEKETIVTITMIIVNLHSVTGNFLFMLLSSLCCNASVQAKVEINLNFVPKPNPSQVLHQNPT